MKNGIFLIISSIIILFLYFSLPSFGETPKPLEIFDEKSNPYNLTYEEHAKNYWKWLTSMPKDINPYEDKTGQKCNNGQVNSNSSVFYLSGNGGGKGERTCHVPSGKGILIPIMVVEVSDKEAPHASVEDLHKIAKKDQDSVTSLYLKIDGKEYNRQDLDKYRTHTDTFEVIFPKNAIFGATEGVSKAAADGYYIITEPVTKGTHTIEFKSSLICAGADCLDPNYAQDIKYNIIVE